VAEVYCFSKWPSRGVKRILVIEISSPKDANYELIKLMNSQKVRYNVIPAQVGVNNQLKARDSRLRGNDGKG
jgi:hypothetical protein